MLEDTPCSGASGNVPLSVGFDICTQDGWQKPLEWPLALGNWKNLKVKVRTRFVMDPHSAKMGGAGRI